MRGQALCFRLGRPFRLPNLSKLFDLRLDDVVGRSVGRKGVGTRVHVALKILCFGSKVVNERRIIHQDKYLLFGLRLLERKFLCNTLCNVESCEPFRNYKTGGTFLTFLQKRQYLQRCDGGGELVFTSLQRRRPAERSQINLSSG